MASFEPDPYDVSCVEGSLYPTFQDASFHAHAAEVQVDVETGRVDVTRYVAAHDVGFAVNPTGIRGQIEGGVAQGIGQALHEEIVYQDGAVLNPSLASYRMPSSLNVPTIEAILVETPGQHGPFGAKGIGEPPIIPPPAAIANAVAHACGARVRVLPITPERVVDSLDARVAR
jgi:CO/xanthine dehydrogenase Mo-binding subunit